MWSIQRMTLRFWMQATWSQDIARSSRASLSQMWRIVCKLQRWRVYGVLSTIEKIWIITSHAKQSDSRLPNRWNLISTAHRSKLMKQTRGNFWLLTKRMDLTETSGKSSKIRRIKLHLSLIIWIKSFISTSGMKMARSATLKMFTLIHGTSIRTLHLSERNYRGTFQRNKSSMTIRIWGTLKYSTLITINMQFSTHAKRPLYFSTENQKDSTSHSKQ